ncbi:hypothetical protein RUM_24030 [Ruminococcus champanellensis 18P13 = JCM 17042]|uniref:Uncharacterized protein n=1 Tax=Ruminococcus champanellensis (strain DSM 18848 / JCM 17042 / KCTC 15320 / 18P13) TaxID=213810 RepID=D4LFJ6_RUMC1|nr:hypothetical protein RUM_24030 [Ruminococcus champanellensis 18P13 = JCM 17042]
MNKMNPAAAVQTMYDAACPVEELHE